MLPIEPVLAELRAVLRARAEAVLVAPPGAGKTTLVPLALLNEEWLGGRRIVMLEPRRLAARSAARRMAQLRGEPIGKTIGYRMRMDSAVGPDTRVEVVTEGILTRRLQQDPSLEDVGMVIFDEFHERSLQADIGLALCLQARTMFRPELRVLIMSATLDSKSIARLLDDAPIIVSEGRSYPVETVYLERRTSERIERSSAQAIRRALMEVPEGDVLVFLPGAREIERTANLLDGLGDGVDVYPLYGNLPQKNQDAAIEAGPPGRRKVVLATDIAETSLTIEGVRVVIDGGLMRVPRFSARSGMTRLATIPVSKASADQRRGRAGRLGPGVCYRLWTRVEQQHLEPRSPAEITQADLAPLALDLARWGARPDELAWLDAPPAGAFAQAEDLLRTLGALDAAGSITPHGRRIADLPLHPRLAHMMLRGDDLGLAALACHIAALVSERDILVSSEGNPDADVRLRLYALLNAGKEAREFEHGLRIDGRAVQHVLRIAAHYRRQLDRATAPHQATTHSGGEKRGAPIPIGAVEAAGILLAFAYPDRIAQQSGDQFRLRNGRIAELPEPQPLSETPYLVAADAGGAGRTSRIFLAAPVTRDDLETYFSDQIETTERLWWDADARLVRARRQRHLGAVILSESPIRDPDGGLLADVMIEAIRAEGLELLPWTKDVRRLQQRIMFMRRRDSRWPDVSDEALLGTLAQWARPHLWGMKRADELQRLSLFETLLEHLTWEQRKELDERAPTHVVVPSGSRIPIDYSDPDAPILPVRLQELFGSTETPRIDHGRVPLTLHLLSPAHRPMQVTQDLASFWRETYFDVRKDLRGRYPKHYWPENPLQAEPTNRAKPRR